MGQFHIHVTGKLYNTAFYTMYRMQKAFRQCIEYYLFYTRTLSSLDMGLKEGLFDLITYYDFSLAFSYGD